ncbi:MAG: type II toxin-antitoxin system HicA family toxin [Planctomycetota bacterium]|nr:type II toxin-antitoxin system HicA family toxin [Planctomycetota bacterium]
MKRRDLIQHIESLGCVFVREGNRHTIYSNPASGIRVPIPRHREIPDIFARTICRQPGISEP